MIAAQGRWVRHGAILVLVADDVEPAPPNLTGVRACWCGAAVNELCRSASGHTREPHPDRTVPRQCLCGAELARFRKMCDECAVEARRETWRSYARRRPTKTRQAAS